MEEAVCEKVLVSNSIPYVCTTGESVEDYQNLYQIDPEKNRLIYNIQECFGEICLVHIEAAVCQIQLQVCRSLGTVHVLQRT